MLRWVAVIALLGLYGASAVAEERPGLLALWGSSVVSSGREVNTKTRETSSVSSFVSGLLTAPNTKRPEVVAIVTSSDGRSSLQHSSVSSSIQRSENSIMFSAIYTDEKSPAQTTRQAILSVQGLGDLRKVTLSEFNQLVQDPDHAKNPLTNGKLDTFEIVLTGHESEHATMDGLTTLLASSPVLFVALQEPTAKAPASMGHYSRILASKSSNLIDGVYYKPEGAEYSIYYANTYLYLTPDIFTGLMSGFFFLATILIGFSCMNQIQGPTSFSNKEQVPAIGREA